MSRPKEWAMLDQKIYTINSMEELRAKLELELEDKQYELDYINSISPDDVYKEYRLCLMQDIKDLQSVYFSFFNLRYEAVH